MGFITGFLKGAGFATATVLITFQIHMANRQHQHRQIREQIDTINALALHTETKEDLHKREAIAGALAQRGYSPRERPPMMELWKERWNQDVQHFVRRAQEVEWQDIRGKADDVWKYLKRSTTGE